MVKIKDNYQNMYPTVTLHFSLSIPSLEDIYQHFFIPFLTQ